MHLGSDASSGRLRATKSSCLGCNGAGMSGAGTVDAVRSSVNDPYMGIYRGYFHGLGTNSSPAVLQGCCIELPPEMMRSMIVATS